MPEVLIRFGGGEAEYLTLRVYGQNRPQDTDYWDGNWLSCTAEVSTGAFRGLLNGMIRNEDLRQFLVRVEELYLRLDGEALFDTLEGWLNLRLIGNGRGHIEALGRLCDDLVHGNTLDFRLFFDQTFLPAIMGQLREAVETFPLVGQI